MSELVVVSDEVRAALEDGAPVVALETTLVAHGFPAPVGVEVGVESDEAVRAAGAVPATVGVLDGRVRVGLEPEELARFTPEARKLGPRDLAACAVGATSEPRRSEAPSPLQAGSASGSSGRAAPAACTAASRPRPTCPPTSRQSRRRQRSW